MIRTCPHPDHIHAKKSVQGDAIGVPCKPRVAHERLGFFLGVVVDESLENTE